MFNRIIGLRSVIAVSVLSAGLIVGASPVGAAFTSIADTTDGFTAFSSSTPWINNLGTVAFGAIPNGTNFQGVYTGDGGPIAAVAQGGIFFSVGNPSINDAGVVAFSGFVSTGGSSVMTNTSSPATTIADSLGAFAGFGKVSIGSSGLVGFLATLDGGAGSGFFADTDGTTVLVQTDATFQSVIPGYGLSDADAGSFYAAHTDGTTKGIYIGDGTTVQTVTDNTGPTFVNFPNRSPMISSDGTVAFLGFLTGGGQAVATGNAGGFAIFADTSGAFDGFASAATNASGSVVFQATLDAGGGGIYHGPTPADKIIGIGDPLFGSTVTNLVFDHALNNQNQIAFWYELASGVQGIAVTEVPEPTTLALLGVFATVWVGRRR